MKYENYNISGSNGKSNCVIRSFCKLYNKEYDDVFNELVSLAHELNCDNFNDVQVFEEYMNRNETYPIEYGKDIRINDLNLDEDEYAVFCWDRDEYYHMVPIINDTLYDKSDESLNLYTMKVYKKKK